MCGKDDKENYITSSNAQLIGFNNILGLLVTLQLFPQKAALVLKLADNLYVSTETRLKNKGSGKKEDFLFCLSFHEVAKHCSPGVQTLMCI